MSSKLAEALPRAAAMRKAMDAGERRLFDNQPAFMQHTLFQTVDPEVPRIRVANWNDQCDVADGWRQDGNNALRRGELDDALTLYEKSIGIWVYIAEKTDKETSQTVRKVGIKDDNLIFHTLFELLERLPSTGEATRVRKCLLAGYLNIAEVSIQLRDFTMAIQSCNLALDIDADSAKALFRRARCRLLDASTGSEVLPDCKEDLQRASLSLQMQIETSGDEELKGSARQMLKEVNSLLAEVEREQRRSDKVLGKAVRQLAEEPFPQNSATKTTKIPTNNSNDDANAPAKPKADASQRTNALLNFEDPSPQLRAAAEKMGIDLHNPRVQRELTRMMQQEIETREGGDGEGSAAAGTGDNGEEEEEELETVDLTSFANKAVKKDSKEDTNAKEDDGKPVDSITELTEIISELDAMDKEDLEEVRTLLRGHNLQVTRVDNVDRLRESIRTTLTKLLEEQKANAALRRRQISQAKWFMFVLLALIVVYRVYVFVSTPAKGAAALSQIKEKFPLPEDLDAWNDEVEEQLGWQERGEF